MKKKFLIILMCIAIISLTACSSKYSEIFHESTKDSVTESIKITPTEIITPTKEITEIPTEKPTISPEDQEKINEIVNGTDEESNFNHTHTYYKNQTKDFLCSVKNGDSYSEEIIPLKICDECGEPLVPDGMLLVVEDNTNMNDSTPIPTELIPPITYDSITPTEEPTSTEEILPTTEPVEVQTYSYNGLEFEFPAKNNKYFEKLLAVDLTNHDYDGTYIGFYDDGTKAIVYMNNCNDEVYYDFGGFEEDSSLERKDPKKWAEYSEDWYQEYLLFINGDKMAVDLNNDEYISDIELYICIDFSLGMKKSMKGVGTY